MRTLIKMHVNWTILFDHTLTREYGWGMYP